MMNEVNALIWPSPDGVGVLNPIGWQQTVRVAKSAGILTAEPGIDAYDQTIAQEAISGLTDDLKGEGFVKATVQVTPGGE
jgi:NitT/TauT family transport system substrate-binding protein